MSRMSWEVVFMDVIPMRVDCPTCGESVWVGTTELSVFYLSQKQEKNSSPVTRRFGNPMAAYCLTLSHGTEPKVVFAKTDVVQARGRVV